MKKKLMSVLLAAAMVASMAVGCGSDKKASSDSGIQRRQRAQRRKQRVTRSYLTDHLH